MAQTVKIDSPKLLKNRNLKKEESEMEQVKMTIFRIRRIQDHAYDVYSNVLHIRRPVQG